MKNVNYNFQEIINKYSDMIYNITIKYLANVEDAEDIVQETFTRYIEMIKENGEFDSEEHIKYWLIKVARNLCVNEINSAKHHKSFSLVEYKAMSEKDININNYDATDKLSSKYRTVFELFYIKDKKISDISKLLCISEANVKTRLRRARNKVKKIMQLGGEKDVK